MSEKRENKEEKSLLARIQEVAGKVDRALLVLRRSDRSHREKSQALEEAATTLVELTLDQGETVLRFTGDWPLIEMRLGAYPVPKESLAALGRRAAQAGLRVVRLKDNLDLEEARKVLEVLAYNRGRERGEKVQPDLVTALWEADLRTVEIETGGEQLQFGNDPEGPFPTFSDAAVFQEIRTPLLLRAGLYLIRGLAQDPDRHERVVPLFTKVITTLVGRGDLTGAESLLGEVDRTRGLPEKSLRALQGSLQPFRDPQWISDQVSILDSMGDTARVADFIRRLGPGAILPLVRGLGEPRPPGALFDLLVILARRDPRPFREILVSGEQGLQADILRVLAEVGEPAVAHIAREVKESEDPLVRSLVLQVLAQAPLEEARGELRQAMNDPEKRVRITAFRLLGRLGGHDDFQTLAMHLRRRAFQRRDGQEKRVILESLARLGREAARDLLGEMLLGPAKGARKGDDTRAGAAAALALLGDEQSRELLEQGAAGKNPEVTQACREALAALRNRAD